jgi:hypothetical protein
MWWSGQQGNIFLALEFSSEMQKYGMNRQT